jgi:hypothetical protein
MAGNEAEKKRLHDTAIREALKALDENDGNTGKTKKWGYEIYRILRELIQEKDLRRVAGSVIKSYTQQALLNDLRDLIAKNILPGYEKKSNSWNCSLFEQGSGILKPAALAEIGYVQKLGKEHDGKQLDLDIEPESEGFTRKIRDHGTRKAFTRTTNQLQDSASHSEADDSVSHGAGVVRDNTREPGKPGRKRPAEKDKDYSPSSFENGGKRLQEKKMKREDPSLGKFGERHPPIRAPKGLHYPQIQPEKSSRVAEMASEQVQVPNATVVDQNPSEVSDRARLHHHAAASPEQQNNDGATAQTDRGSLQEPAASIASPSTRATQPSVPDRLRDLETGMDWKDIKAGHNSIFGNVREAVSLCLKCKGYEANCEADFVTNPGPELQVLYTMVWGANWRSGLLPARDRGDSKRVSAFWAFCGLISAELLKSVFMPALPWDLERLQEAAQGPSFQFVQGAAEQTGYPLVKILKNAKLRQIKSEEFREATVRPHAKELAEKLVMNIKPHLDLLKKQERPNKDEELPKGESWAWRESVQKAFFDAVVLKHKMESAEHGTFEYFWVKGGKKFAGEQMKSIDGTEADVIFPLFLGIRRRNAGAVEYLAKAVVLTKKLAKS